MAAGNAANTTPVQIAVTADVLSALRNITQVANALRTQMAGAANQANRSVSSLGDTLKKSLGGAKSAMAGLAAAVGGFALVKKGLDFNQQMRDGEVAIANVVSQFQNLDLVASRQVAAKAMAKIVELEPKTAATLGGLQQGFIATLAAAQAANIGIEDHIDLVGKMANAVANINLPQEQLTQELRALFTGNITADAALAKSLNITAPEINKAKEQGTLLDYLNKKVGKLGEAGDTVGVAFSSLASSFEKSLGLLTADLLDEIVRGAKALATELERPAVQESLKNIGVQIGMMAEVAVDNLPLAMDLLLELGDIVASIAGVFRSAATAFNIFLKPMRDLTPSYRAARNALYGAKGDGIGMFENSDRGVDAYRERKRLRGLDADERAIAIDKAQRAGAKPEYGAPSTSVPVDPEEREKLAEEAKKKRLDAEKDFWKAKRQIEEQGISNSPLNKQIEFWQGRARAAIAAIRLDRVFDTGGKAEQFENTLAGILDLANKLAAKGDFIGARKVMEGAAALQEAQQKAKELQEKQEEAQKDANDRAKEVFRNNNDYISSVRRAQSVLAGGENTMDVFKIDTEASIREMSRRFQKDLMVDENAGNAMAGNLVAQQMLFQNRGALRAAQEASLGGIVADSLTEIGGGGGGFVSGIGERQIELLEQQNEYLKGILESVQSGEGVGIAISS